MNIVKSEDILVFIDLFRRYFVANNFAENAVFVSAHVETKLSQLLLKIMREAARFRERFAVIACVTAALHTSWFATPIDSVYGEGRAARSSRPDIPSRRASSEITSCAPRSCRASATSI
jgi:hypothetical protein